jgi:predicted DNA-binding protein
MAIHITPEHEARINELAQQTGRENAEVLGEVIDSYFEELARINATLNRRYDESTSGQVKPISGEEVFERLRRKSEERRAQRE